MQTKFVALVLVTLLVGFGGGYELGYTVYQSQEENPLQTFRDSVEITVLQREILMRNETVDEEWNVNVPLTLAFALRSKPAFQKVTDLWISLEAEGSSISYNHQTQKAYFELDFTFNKETTYHFSKEEKIAGTHVLSVHVPDENVYASIVPSINNLTLTNPEIRRYGVFTYYSMIIHRVTLFIEYEYQTR